MSGTVVPRSGLDAEGDQVGADFRLGERTGAWSARRYSGSFGCGLTLAVMLAVTVFVPFLPYPWPGGVIAVFSYLGLLALMALLLAVPGRTWKERVHWRDISEIEMLMYGHRMSISYSKWRARKVSLDGAPNDFLARYVIGYAASRTGVRITGGTNAGR